jgi:hypothetical protein
MLASLPALAGGTIAGHVTDISGGILPGVTVEARGRTVRITTTRADGSYKIERLAPGQYDVAFKLINFATSVQRAAVVAERHS